jgi:hypothetical protein
MSYLDIARATVAGCETSESSEISPEPGQSQSGTMDEARAIPDVRRHCLPRQEATALGLNPDLIWMRVSRDEVEASKPPPSWDRTLPDVCRWRSLCQSLGPCQRHLVGQPCWVDRISS